MNFVNKLYIFSRSYISAQKCNCTIVKSQIGRWTKADIIIQKHPLTTTTPQCPGAYFWLDELSN